MAQGKGKATVAVTAIGAGTERVVTVVASGTDPDAVLKAARDAAHVQGVSLPEKK